MNKDRTHGARPATPISDHGARGFAYRQSDLGLGLRVDAQEVRSGVPDLLRAHGATVVVERLVAGDYAIGDRILVERKSPDDFIQSLRSGRLFGQAYKLAGRSPRPLVVMEGDPYELLPPDQRISLRGAVLSLMTGYGIPVLQTRSTHETAACLIHILQQEVRRTQRRSRRAGQAVTASPAISVPPNVLAVLEALPDVGATRARALASSFGSLASLVAADLRQLMEVPGIGPHTASKIYETLRTLGRATPRSSA